MLFDRDYLWSYIRDDDLAFTEKYSASGGKLQLAADAAKAAKQGFSGMPLQKLIVRRKIAYVVRDAPRLVLLRAINDLLIEATGIRLSDRDTIIRRLVTVLSEGVLHHVHKFDVKSFFESVDTKRLVEQLSRDIRVPRIVSIQIEKLFAELEAQGIPGLPRGVPLSATLAEYAMQAFDASISRAGDVYFYARFVDDVIVVTGGRTTPSSFQRFALKRLPEGLVFNTSKTRHCSLVVDRKGTGTTSLGSFDYLGYNFEMFDTTKNKDDRLHRPLAVSISPRKLQRLKSRLCRTFAAFAIDGNLALLHRRLQMLTGNYNIRDASTKQNRNVGLFCSYRQITHRDGLLEVDRLLRAIVAGNKGDLAKRVGAKLLPRQRRALLVYGFHRSFEQRQFYNFSAKEIVALTRCWHHA